MVPRLKTALVVARLAQLAASLEIEALDAAPPAAIAATAAAVS